MATFRRFLLRLVHFFQPHRAESELERELAAHLGVLEDEYKRRGLSDASVTARGRRQSSHIRRRVLGNAPELVVGQRQQIAHRRPRAARRGSSRRRIRTE